jgi:orotidine-5'-phosphate decarboxylase
VTGAVRARLALALDTDDADEALESARRLRPWFGVAKAGYPLLYSAGPQIVPQLVDLGYDVFVDL